MVVPFPFYTTSRRIIIVTFILVVCFQVPATTIFVSSSSMAFTVRSILGRGRGRGGGRRQQQQTQQCSNRIIFNWLEMGQSKTIPWWFIPRTTTFHHQKPCTRWSTTGITTTTTTTTTTRAAASSSSSSSSSSTTTNQELVERRLAVARAKREARERMIQERVEKNWRVKQLLESSDTMTMSNYTTSTSKNNTNHKDGSYPIPPLYAVKVWVADDLRNDLALTGREKRGRVFIEAAAATSDGATTTLRGLKQELHAFFRALRKNTFLLRGSLPLVAPDGTLLSSPEDGNATAAATNASWPIETDEDVIRTFQTADAFFEENQSLLKRPSIQISVLKDPNAPPLPPPPTYLQDMQDPNESETMTMLSFYAFPPKGIDDPEAFAFDMKKKWKPFQALGRVYVAEEGVNAQMSIPTNVLQNFMECCRSIPELGNYMENGINIDPKPLTREEFASAGVPVNGEPAPPFRNLHVRVR